MDLNGVGGDLSAVIANADDRPLLVDTSNMIAMISQRRMLHTSSPLKLDASAAYSPRRAKIIPLH
jgi:hypothetical protein